MGDLFECFRQVGDHDRCGIDDAVAIDDLGIDDDPEWNLSKNLSDTASTTDAGLLIMQDYCDITYFLEDYVGTSRTF